MSRLIWIYAVCKPIIIACGSEKVNTTVLKLKLVHFNLLPVDNV